jgi:hypothetical protein
MLKLKVPFAFVRTRYARFCGVRTCPAGFGLLHLVSHFCPLAGAEVRIQGSGITGATTEAERADAVFPVIAADGSRHAILISWPHAQTKRSCLLRSCSGLGRIQGQFCTDLDNDNVDLYTRVNALHSFSQAMLLSQEDRQEDLSWRAHSSYQ